MQVVIFLHPIQLGISLSENKQWGFSTATTNKFTWVYPVTFSNKICYINATLIDTSISTSNWYGYPITLPDTKQCTFRTWGQGTPLRLFCIGVQQWGVVTEQITSLTFPIAFTNTNYKVIVTSSNKAGDTGGVNHIVEPTDLQKVNLYLRYSNSNSLVNGWNSANRKTNPMWIAIGQQLSNASRLLIPSYILLKLFLLQRYSQG